MIVVIADDLSGAAELAGAAVRHGLTAEVQTSFFPGTNAEVVCVDTNSRLLSDADAAARLAAVTRSVMAAKPAWVFKKCDSVLRGPVLAEARAVASVTGSPRILLIPANPSRGRTISAGQYLIAGEPLSKTFFSRDPCHPRLTADVTKLLGGDLTNVTVPDIATENDIHHQVETMDAQVLPAGAVDFFAALLTRRTAQKSARAGPGLARKGKTLLVCGSAAAWPGRVHLAQEHRIPAFTLPHDISAVVGSIRINETVLLGIGNGPATVEATPEKLVMQLAQSVGAVLRQTRVDRLLLEGGATAATTLAALGWTRLQTEQVAASGVGVLRPAAPQAPRLFIKPGSYAWPEAIWP
jgi:uncharacterized protein YgbK (DUF1537 family)